MAFDPTKPLGSNPASSVDDDCRANFAVLGTVLETASLNSGYVKQGLGRVYTNDRSVALPTLPAGGEEGSIWRNSEANYEGQLYIHNGTNWIPLSSQRVWYATANGALADRATGAWIEWDSNLRLGINTEDSTGNPEEQWQLECRFALDMLCDTAGASVEIRIQDGTIGVPGTTLYQNRIIWPYNAGQLLVSGHFIYPYTSKGAQTIEIDIYGTAGAVLTRGAGGGGGGVTPEDYFTIKEIPIF